MLHRSQMIGRINHKALRRLYENNDSRGLPPDMVQRLREILTALSLARDVEALNRPSFRLHALRGNMRGFWAVVFRFENEAFVDVDFLDYH